MLLICAMAAGTLASVSAEPLSNSAKLELAALSKRIQSSKSAQAYARRAVFYSENGLYLNSLNDLDEAIRPEHKHEHEPTYHGLRAIMLERLGRHDACIEEATVTMELAKGIDVDTYISALKTRAHAYRKIKKDREAEDDERFAKKLLADPAMRQGDLQDSK